MAADMEIERAFERREETERQQLPSSLPELFDKATREFADRIFWRTVEGDGQVLTYREFKSLVDRCASAFRRFGISRGTHVALALPNIPEMGAAWIALQRLGAVTVGVNVNLVPHEIEYTLRMADADALIIGSHYASIVDAIGIDRLPFPTDRIVVHGGAYNGKYKSWDDLLADAFDTVKPAATDATELASILYTSGSMGLPKPAMLPNSWHTISAWVRSRQGPVPQNILIDSPLYYMGAQWRLGMAMYLGATLCVASKPTLKGYVDRLLNHGINLCAVTSQTAKLPDDPRYAQLKLAWVTSSGLPKDMQPLLEARLGAPVREIYGTTEIGSAIVMPAMITDMVGSGSCGLPDAFRKCRIVDSNGNDVPQGQGGELWVSGPGISLGYYKNEEATAATHTGEWYRTGDLFIQDSRGFYFWQSRLKDIIRRSKENISSVEVETAVRSMPEVLEACAIAVPDSYRDEEVKVYVQLVPGCTQNSVPPANILGHAAKRLAPFKVPRYIEYVTEFERTASNKVSKLALRQAKQDLRIGSYDAVEDVWR